MTDGPGDDACQADEDDEAGHDADEAEGARGESVRDKGQNRNCEDSRNGREGNGLSHGFSNPGGRLRAGLFTSAKVLSGPADPTDEAPSGGCHAAAFGFSNAEWVLDPLASFRVERFLLLEMPGVDKARLKQAAKGVDLDAELGRVCKKVDRVEVDLWDPGAVGRVLLDEAKKHGSLAANISEGPNPWCLGAHLASMFGPVRVYHVTRDGKGVLWMPSVRLDSPTRGELAILSVLAANKKGASGGKLRSNLRDMGAFESDGESPERNREQSKLRTMRSRLEEWGAIKIGGTETRRWYSLTTAGAALATMFAGTVATNK